MTLRSPGYNEGIWGRKAPRRGRRKREASVAKIMPPLPESERETRAYLAERKCKSEAYLKGCKDAEQQPLRDIHSIARRLLYPTASNAQPTQNAGGAGDRSVSEYEPDAEEEAHFAEEALRDEEEVALAMSKEMHLPF
ncbi:uncharacterized protein [Aegilops tauschii subsp. strangulata]|uniref:uncharacterized protein isoform X1 n=1 Tax=Aegilops tauschii subsp. strangulata TaxID=200361 RepID=UPI00098BA45B|nr:uncharacterized protein LOC109784123 isoform X1 [Aegilops tauschii subsp. strangulata]XP_045085495.1 uncharacterized protein LOC109784123 isoform X1 [Aegilops tauschii subsp. strangulata]